MEKIIDSKIFRKGKKRQLAYLVKWEGYPDLTCELAKYLKNVDAVKEFHSQHPKKPKITIKGPRKSFGR